MTGGPFGGESTTMARGSTSVNQSSRGVFLSYASEDAGVAKRICDALRDAGIEVWFDQSELRGGDAWDQKIRQQIRDCALFVPIISAHTQSRPEGYFRLEWKLAVDRSHLMAAEKAFLVPVVVDGTTEPEALVPAQFREVQWTRTPAGDLPAAFVERIAALLNQPITHHVGSPEREVKRAPTGRRSTVLIAISVAVAVGLVVAAAMQGLGHKPVPKVEASNPSAPVATTPATIPEKSVAVLPFVDMSEKQDEGYFSDGLSEELIDMLAKVPDLRVPARTSSFYFKGKQATIAEIARALGVAHILEGSVRRSRKNLRVTAQLIRVDTGYHVWSETFDRTVNDVFKLQDEIAGAVVQALKVSLLRQNQPRAAPTSSADAYAQYLQGRSLMQHGTLVGYQNGREYLERAVTLDPRFAAAWAALATAPLYLHGYFQDRPYGEYRPPAFRAATRALALDPGLADGHLALARIFYELDWDWDAADRELRRALAADPRSAESLRTAANLALTRGRAADAVRLAERAIEIDPVNALNYHALALASSGAGDLQTAETASRKAVELNPSGAVVHYWLARALLWRGKAAEAFAAIQNEPAAHFRNSGLAMIVDTGEHRREADRALATLEQQDAAGSAYQIADAYARRHDLAKTFEWLDRAYRQRDGGMLSIRQGMPRDITSDPRFAVLLRKMNLADQ
jgi:adenylate cyclase